MQSLASDIDSHSKVSGRHAIVQDVSLSAFADHVLFKSIPQLQHKIERNEATFKFNALTDDIYAVSSLLKVLYASDNYVLTRH